MSQSLSPLILVQYAEVQNVHQDGSLTLHTRNLNYGKVK